MSLATDFIIVLASAAAIIFSAEFAIRSSVAIAKKFRLSDELIGMTILSIGTSIPEIVTHIIGSYQIVKDNSMMNQISGLVIGANIGSDIFQQNFIIGLIGIIGIVVVRKKDLIKDMGSLIAAAALLLIFCIGGFITRTEGAILIILYIIYLYILKKYGMAEGEEIELGRKKNHAVKNIVIILSSFMIMMIAGDWMLKSSESLIDALPISASFFGIIMLGVVSAFPELTTSLIAISKNKARISAGILIGSNITNPMLALGLGALISGYTVPNVIIWYDLPVKIITGILLFMMLIKGKLKKWQAVCLVMMYIAYLFFRNMYFPADF